MRQDHTIVINGVDVTNMQYELQPDGTVSVWQTYSGSTPDDEPTDEPTDTDSGDETTPA